LKAFNLRAGGTSPTEKNQFIKHFPISFRDRLDLSIRKISNPTGGSKPAGSIGYSSPKEDTLDKTTNQDPSSSLQNRDRKSFKPAEFLDRRALNL
jgi:hypothetical protein